ncbi:MAG: 50S ribosomal protein L10 [Elusimicrobiota bacterium]
MLRKQDKERLVLELEDKLGKSKSLFFAHYKGMKVSEMYDLRVKLRTLSAEYKVTKHTLTKIVLKKKNIQEPEKVFSAPTGIVFCYDDNVTEVCKLLASYSKEHDKFKMHSGYTEGQSLTLKDIGELAKIPSKQALYGSITGVFNSLLFQLTYVLNAPVMQVVQSLEYRSKNEKSN